MLKLGFAFLITFCSLSLWAQDGYDLHRNGVRFLQQGDYSNAIIVLKQAVDLIPNDPQVVNDLGVAYFMAGQYKMGYELMVPLAESQYSNDQTFVIAAMNLLGGKNKEEAEQVYKMGLVRFPKSGALHADYGEFLVNTPPGKDGKIPSITYWEKGIQVDPAYPVNYYHAAKYHLKYDNPFWAAVYGELFINMETYTSRTIEIKALVYDAYKRLYAYELPKKQAESPFEGLVKSTLLQQNSLITNGITPEILTAIRTRFILDWYFIAPENRPPFQLFSYHKHLLEQGIFEAYNQWLFGSADNPVAFKTWTQLHPDEYVAFNQDRRVNFFTIGENEYYR